MNSNAMLRTLPRAPAFADRPSSKLSSSPSLFAHLDCSNTYIAGAQVSAARNGMAASPDAAASNGIIDFDFRIDFAKLRAFAVGEDPSNLARTVCVGSSKVGSDGAIWKMAQKAGWTTITPERSRSGREKEVDTTLAVVLLEDLLLADANAEDIEVTIFSGDRDLLPAIKAVQRRGFAVDVAAWSHATSKEVRIAARRFIPLDDYFELLSYRAQHH